MESSNEPKTETSAEQQNASSDNSNLNETEDEVLFAKLNAHPEDFDGWVSLVKLVEKRGELDRVRRALEGLLKEYPLCFGYWKRWAGHEKEHGDEDACLEVLERGVVATPYSPRLWQQYLLDWKSIKPEDIDGLRALYERAVAVVGHEFQSHTLWNSYLEFEQDQVMGAQVALGGEGESASGGDEDGNIGSGSGSKQPDHSHILALYLRILSAPIQQLDEFWSRFQSFAVAVPLQACVVAYETFTKSTIPEEDRTSSSGVMKHYQSLYNRGTHLKNQVSRFEGGILRPYFHSKPLDSADLHNWQEYLRWASNEVNKVYPSKSPSPSPSSFKKEESGGDGGDEKANGGSSGSGSEGNEGEKLPHGTPGTLTFQDLVHLWERAMVACANYQAMWSRYANWMEGYDVEKAREIHERATTHFVKRNPRAYVVQANFEERHGNSGKARRAFEQLQLVAPLYLDGIVARVNFERRNKGDVKKVYTDVIARFTAATATDATPHSAQTSASALDGVVDQSKERSNEAADSASSLLFISQHYVKYLQLTKAGVKACRSVYENALSTISSHHQNSDHEEGSSSSSSSSSGGGGSSKDSDSSAKLAGGVLAVFWLAYITWEADHAGSDESLVQQLFERAVKDNDISHEQRAVVWEHYIAYMEDRSSSLEEVEKVKERYNALFVGEQGGASRKRKEENKARSAVSAPNAVSPASSTNASHTVAASSDDTQSSKKQKTEEGKQDDAAQQQYQAQYQQQQAMYEQYMQAMAQQYYQAGGQPQQ